MPRKVIGGLIQAATPLTDPEAPIEKVRDEAIAIHEPLIEEAGKRGVQILGLQEVFNGPYFCPAQDPHWYGLAEPVPGPTTERLDMIEEVRRIWQFYGDRRPETYGDMAEMLP